MCCVHLAWMVLQYCWSWAERWFALWLVQQISYLSRPLNGTVNASVLSNCIHSLDLLLNNCSGYRLHLHKISICPGSIYCTDFGTCTFALLHNWLCRQLRAVLHVLCQWRSTVWNGTVKGFRVGKGRKEVGYFFSLCPSQWTVVFGERLWPWVTMEAWAAEASLSCLKCHFCEFFVWTLWWLVGRKFNSKNCWKTVYTLNTWFHPHFWCINTQA